MAKEDIGVKIGIEGEREFKQALKSIDDGLKLTATEMALVQPDILTMPNQ